MSAINILITRPTVQAARTASAVEKLGGNPFILPLSEIVPLDFTLPPACDVLGFDGLLASSANAFTTLQQGNMLAHFHALPLFCVGEQTAHAARNAGFNRIATIADDASSLNQVLKKQKSRHFLYLAGKHRRPVLEAALTTRGIEITILEIYDQRPLLPATQNLATLPAHLDYVLLYSSFAAQQLCHLIPHLAPSIDATTRFLCLSPRISATLPMPYAAQGTNPQRPDEAALLGLLGDDIKRHF